MPVRRILLAAALLLLLPQASAGAAVLIEARKHGEPFRMVVDNEQQRALIATARGESLVDLRRGELYLRGPRGVARKMRLASPAALAGVAYRVEPWGPGPVMSGHATVYHVISHGEEICAEMLVSGWMTPFVRAGGAGARPARGPERHAARRRLRADPVRGLRRPAGRSWPARSTT